MAEVSTAELAAALIAVFEGERLEAYQDSGGVWTIGIGHTKGAHEGQMITHEMAVQLFAEDAAPLLKMVADRPVLEAAALVSFGFNCGAHNLALILAGQGLITDPVHTTDRHGNVLLRGLVARRRLEETLILVSDDGKRA